MARASTKNERFYCPKHGWQNSSHCVICRTKAYKERVERGLIENKKLEEMNDRRPEDPSPLQIRFRCIMQRKHRHH